jgi:hypothetical protein
MRFYLVVVENDGQWKTLHRCGGSLKLAQQLAEKEGQKRLAAVVVLAGGQAKVLATFRPLVARDTVTSHDTLPDKP